MKKIRILAIILIFLIVSLAVFLAFRFHGSADEYSGKRPCDYPNTHWVSKETSSYFDVVKSDKSDNYQCKGKIVKHNGEIIEFSLLFDTDGGVEFWKDNSKRLLKGNVPSFLTFAQFYSDKLIITNITEDKIFNNKYDRILFKKSNN